LCAVVALAGFPYPSANLEDSMITAMHALIYSKDPDGVREFLRDKLGLRYVDSGGGWLIFALPPAELGVHPTDGGGKHELYLMCDDLDATMAELAAKGVEFTGEVHEQDWGRETAIRLPGGDTLGLYQPRHPPAFNLPS
jgi:catechol 2,3-dioxygenase-like lactoylglutathione lyase family enzyme